MTIWLPTKKTNTIYRQSVEIKSPTSICTSRGRGRGSGKEFTCQYRRCRRDDGLSSGSGRSPGIGNGNLFQCSCLENSTDRGAWRATIHRVRKSWTGVSNKAQHRTARTATWPGMGMEGTNYTWIKARNITGCARPAPADEAIFMTLETKQSHMVHCSWAFLMAQLVKRLPAVRETWVHSLGQKDPLEEETATHSSILAWKTPWTEKPGRLQSYQVKRSYQLQKVRHDSVTSLSFFHTVHGHKCL